MPGDQAPGTQSEKKLNKEKVSRSLSFVSRRLDFMHRKIERHHKEGEPLSLVGEGEPDLTEEELQSLWEAIIKFSPAMEEMDDVLTAIMNKDAKI